MTTIKASASAYEQWLRTQIGPDFVEKDLEKKHAKMQASPFAFLRATYWRWAEIILDICPDLADAPEVLAIGDTHLENFGTWRDREDRLIWGANDFDEAAIMPYPLDILRLAVSALLAAGKNGPDTRDICTPLLAGYKSGLATPLPFVLERDHKWLRKAVMLPEAEREAFWQKFEALQPSAAPALYRDALQAAMPSREIVPIIAARTAGTGSLGRPRFVARKDWNGGPILREAKAVVTSAWSLRHAPQATGIAIMDIAEGRFRAPDPHYRVLDKILIRRLSPNSRKIEVKTSVDELVAPKMLEAMGWEIGNCHAGDEDRLTAIDADLTRRPETWLCDAAKAAAKVIIQEQAEYC